MSAVTSAGWNVSTTTGTHIDGAILSAFKGFAPSGQTRKGEHYGRRFPSSGAAFAFAEEYGYSQPYLSRPSGFISLKLSPRSRREAKHILTCWGEKYALRFVAKLLARSDHDGGKYLNSVMTADHFASRRAEWVEYIRNA